MADKINRRDCVLCGTFGNITTNFTAFNLTESLSGKTFVILLGGAWGNIEATAFLPISEFKRCSNSSQVISMDVSVAYQTTYQRVYVYYGDNNTIYAKASASGDQQALRVYAI